MALINSFNYGELAVPKDFAVHCTHCTPLGCLFCSGLYLTTNLPAHAKAYAILEPGTDSEFHGFRFG